jgi:OOP family OmpA-OmpF porin
MSVRSFKPLATAAVIAASLAALTAHAEGLYVGGSIGVPHYGDGVAGIAGDGSGASGKVFGGWQLNPNFALEGGLASLGHISNANGSVHGHATYLDAVGLLPLGASFSLLGSMGVTHVNLNTSNGDDSGVGLKLGLGAEYALSSKVSLRGEYENYRASEFGSHPAVGQYTFGVRVGF